MLCVNNQKKNYKELVTDENDDIRPEFTIINYVKTGKAAAHYHKKPVLYDSDYDGYGYLVERGVLKHTNSDFPHIDKEYINNGVSACLVLNTGKRIKNYKLFILHNADENDENGNPISYIETSKLYIFPSISFQCVMRLIGAKSTVKVGELFANGTLTVLDWTKDQYLAVKKGENPPSGYTLRGNQWHRPSSLLFFDNKSRKTYLLGQDGDSYFGVELPETAGTITQAFRVLMPKSIRGKKNIKRQGEWFVCPVKNVPEVGVVTVNAANSDFGDEIILPLDTPESHPHILVAQEIRLDLLNNRMYALNLSLTHDQHSSISTSVEDGWYEIVRNTAVKSVSVEGVD